MCDDEEGTAGCKREGEKGRRGGRRTFVSSAVWIIHLSDTFPSTFYVISCRERKTEREREIDR
jgi:hypothetical protein